MLASIKKINCGFGAIFHFLSLLDMASPRGNPIFLQVFIVELHIGVMEV
jgi:hypothetical protein